MSFTLHETFQVATTLLVEEPKVTFQNYDLSLTLTTWNLEERRIAPTGLCQLLASFLGIL